MPFRWRSDRCYSGFWLVGCVSDRVTSVSPTYIKCCISISKGHLSMSKGHLAISKGHLDIKRALPITRPACHSCVTKFPHLVCIKPFFVSGFTSLVGPGLRFLLCFQGFPIWNLIDPWSIRYHGTFKAVTN